MHHGKTLIIVIVLVVSGGLFLLSADSRPATGASLPAASGSPSPLPVPTVTATPHPASSAVVGWALKWRRAAVREWKQWNRARSALGSAVVRFNKGSARRPLRSASGAKWMDAGRGWKADRSRYVARTGKLVERMKHPGGSSNGTRWKPLMRHLGYPESILSTFAAIVMRESSGRERAYNPSGAAGLLQFMSGWYRGQWGYPAFNPFDAEQSLRAGLHVWREQGFQPWAM